MSFPLACDTKDDVLLGLTVTAVEPSPDASRLLVSLDVAEPLTPSDRAAILELLQDLPTAVAADSAEVLGFIERHGLHGKGIGYVDVHLLASVALTAASRLWTRDKRLHAAAQDLGMAYEGAGPH